MIKEHKDQQDTYHYFIYHFFKLRREGIGTKFMKRQIRQIWKAPYSRYSFGKELSHHEIWKVILAKYQADKATFTNSPNKDVYYISPSILAFLTIFTILYRDAV